MSSMDEPDAKPVPHRFDLDTAVERIAPGRYRAQIDRGWWIVAGPNGGYIAALLLRAMRDAVEDAARIPRTLTIHYLRPPAEGEAEVLTTVERAGRMQTTVTARLEQAGVPMAIAIGAFSSLAQGVDFDDAPMIEAPAPEKLAIADAYEIPMTERYERRFLPGAGRDAVSEHARVAAWLRFAPPRTIDYEALAAYTDALPPAIFATGHDPVALGGVPTIELTIHFRRALDSLVLAPDAHLLCVCTTQIAREGFLDEDCSVWSPGGELLAQSRQLAIARGA